MIIKIHRPGRSFRGVCRYLTHDADGASTAERVAWTHMLNLTADDKDVSSAVNEMLWTYRAADALKREAGVSTGGSKLEKPVKHFSLSWPHGAEPTKEQIIDTVRAYMAHMGWADRQAVLVAHNDTRHAHAHVVMNSVSPEDGRAVRSSHDWRRTEAFALHYEREHGQIHCEQRLKPQGEREATPTREAWQRFKKSEIAFERTEVERLTKTLGYFERHDDKVMNSREWDALKKYQQQQREQLFIDGKEAFRAVRKDVFKDVREEFRPQWKAFHAAKRHGDDPTALAATKASLLKAQQKKLVEARDTACEALRETRDKAYEAILAQQRFDRAELGKRQEKGLRTFPLFDLIYPAPEPVPLAQEKSGKEQKTSAWHAREADPAASAANEMEFDRGARGVADPAPSRRNEERLPHGIVRLGEVTPPLADGFGRPLKEFADAEQPPREAVAPVKLTRQPGAEITDAVAAKEPAAKAREMNAREEAKDRKEVQEILASWTRASRRRSRGGRD